MEYQYKTEITKLLEDPYWEGFFVAPPAGDREYPLILPKGRCQADFCYQLKPSGKLSIEDDDAPRVVNNLIKYGE